VRKIPVVQETLVCLSPTASLVLSPIRHFEQVAKSESLRVVHGTPQKEEYEFKTHPDRPFRYGCAKILEPEGLVDDDGNLAPKATSAMVVLEFENIGTIMQGISDRAQARRVEMTDCEVILDAQNDLELSDPPLMEVGSLLTRRNLYVILPRMVSPEKIERFSHRLLKETYREGMAGANGMEGFHMLEAWADGQWKDYYMVSKACRITPEVEGGQMEAMCAAMTAIVLCHHYCKQENCPLAGQKNRGAGKKTMLPPRDFGPFQLLCWKVA
jgi:hypothetical protein